MMKIQILDWKSHEIVPVKRGGKDIKRDSGARPGEFGIRPLSRLLPPSPAQEQMDPPIGSFYKCIFPVMPDLIRHPDVVPTPYQVRGKLQSGTTSKTGLGFHRDPWIPAFAGMTTFSEAVSLWADTK